MCPSPSFFLVAGCSLSVFQQGTYTQFWKIFYPSICTSYWPICLPPFNSQQVTFALIFSSFLFFNLRFLPSLLKMPFLRPHSACLDWVLGSSFFPPWRILFPWLLLPGELVTHLLALGLIFLSSLNAPFVPALQGVSYGCVIGCPHLSYSCTVSCPVIVHISSWRPLSIHTCLLLLSVIIQLFPMQREELCSFCIAWR